MKVDILQTRLYFADAIACRNNEDLKKAEENAAAFKKNSSELLDLNEEYRTDLEKLNVSFEKFYKYGGEMTDVYLKNGYEAGNKMMEEFDKMADDLNKKVDLIQMKSQNSMDGDLTTIGKYISVNSNRGIVIAILTIVLSIAIAIIVGNGIRIPINSLLSIFMDLEKGQGDLTNRIEIKSKDEIGRMAQAFNKFIDSLENMVLNIKRNSDIVSKGSERLSAGGLETTKGISYINNYMAKVIDDTQRINASVNQITTSVSEIAQASQITAADAQKSLMHQVILTL